MNYLPPIGTRVLVDGYEHLGERKIAGHYNQDYYPGGLYLDEPVDLFVSWNIDSLTPLLPCGLSPG